MLLADNKKSPDRLRYKQQIRALQVEAVAGTTTYSLLIILPSQQLFFGLSSLDSSIAMIWKPTLRRFGRFG